MTNTLTYAELSTILAALRLWQSTTGLYGYASKKYHEHFVGTNPLTSPEIDSLCERLNAGEIVRVEGGPKG